MQRRYLIGGILWSLLASNICQRNQQPFPLCLCHFSVKECLYDTETLGAS